MREHRCIRACASRGGGAATMVSPAESVGILAWSTESRRPARSNLEARPQDCRASDGLQWPAASPASPGDVPWSPANAPVPDVRVRRQHPPQSAGRRTADAPGARHGSARGSNPVTPVDAPRPDAANRTGTYQAAALSTRHNLHRSAPEPNTSSTMPELPEGTINAFIQNKKIGQIWPAQGQ